MRLLRAAVASAGNDHRLGANEAPPAIISIFLGECRYHRQIEKGGPSPRRAAALSKSAWILSNTSARRHRPWEPRPLPSRVLFEFRAVGSNMSLAGANVVLNTIAEAVSEMSDKLEADMKAKKDLTSHCKNSFATSSRQRVLYNGDNYTAAWHAEAKKRGLLNLKTTPEALEEFKKESAIALFEKHGVLSRKEMLSRYEVYTHTYKTILQYEGQCAVEIAKTMIVPVAIEYQNELASTIKAVAGAGKGNKTTASKGLLKDVCDQTDAALVAVGQLETALEGHKSDKILAGMAVRVRGCAGAIIAGGTPLPTYAQMMYLI